MTFKIVIKGDHLGWHQYLYISANKYFEGVWGGKTVSGLNQRIKYAPSFSHLFLNILY